MKQFLTYLLLFTSLSVCAQNEWETAVPSSLAWKADARMTTHSSSLGNLKSSNLTTETTEKGKWSSLSVSLNQVIDLTTPCEITFDVTNTNNILYNSQPKFAYKTKKIKSGRVVANVVQSILLFPIGLGSWLWNPARETKNYYYKDKGTKTQVYWGYSVSVKTKSGLIETFRRNFCDGLNSSTDYSDSDNSTWRKYYGAKNHNLRFVYTDEHKLEIYDNRDLVKTFTNVSKITAVDLIAGCESKLESKNFTIRRKTPYGMSLQLLQLATSQMQENNWYGAAKILSTIIDEKQYRDTKVYYLRAYCNTQQNNFRTAIDDLTRAINVTIGSKEDKEAAYYLRGYCKAQLEDIDCVNDMRKAGEDGRIWLKEMQLENFYPSQSVINEVTVHHSQSERPTKKLSTNKKPQLKK